MNMDQTFADFARDLYGKKSRRTGQHEVDVAVSALGADWIATARFDATYEAPADDLPGGWTIDIDSCAIVPNLLRNTNAPVEIDYSELPTDAQEAIERAAIEQVQ